MIITAMVSQKQAVRVEGGVSTEVDESLLIEEPLQININGRPFSITMRTPGDDAHLVKGLLLTEGVVDIEGLGVEVQIDPREGYTEANVAVPEIYLCENLLEKRSLISNASCGVCGKRQMADVKLSHPSIASGQMLPAAVIPRLGPQMRERQHGFDATGGCHAAAAFAVDGTFLAQCEDVGRHNAVDKVIGHLISRKLIGKAAILMVSGRVSFEIVSKAAVAQIPFLCAVSAASSLAVSMAESTGITLIAFCRDDRFTVYSNPQHIQFQEPRHG